jgi:hypothetical protein
MLKWKTYQSFNQIRIGRELQGTLICSVEEGAEKRPTQAKDKNSNPYFEVSSINITIISEKATLNPVGGRQVYEYDIKTKSGELIELNSSE